MVILIVEGKWLFILVCSIKFTTNIERDIEMILDDVILFDLSHASHKRGGEKNN